MFKPGSEIQQNFVKYCEKKKTFPVCFSNTCVIQEFFGGAGRAQHGLSRPLPAKVKAKFHAKGPRDHFHWELV